MTTGNFHGEPLAFAADMLAMAIAELASISERRVDRMLDPAFSRGLPPFLAPAAGTNSGFMLAQYTAASLVSENKVLAHPASVGTIATSGERTGVASARRAAGRDALLCVAEQVVQFRLDVDVAAFLAGRDDLICPLQERRHSLGRRLKVSLAEWRRQLDIQDLSGDSRGLRRPDHLQVAGFRDRHRGGPHLHIALTLARLDPRRQQVPGEDPLDRLG